MIAMLRDLSSLLSQETSSSAALVSILIDIAFFIDQMDNAMSVVTQMRSVLELVGSAIEKIVEIKSVSWPFRVPYLRTS